jgi:hypothetical protein
LLQLLQLAFFFLEFRAHSRTRSSCLAICSRTFDADRNPLAEMGFALPFPFALSSAANISESHTPFPQQTCGNVVDQQFATDCSFRSDLACIWRLDRHDVERTEEPSDFRYVVQRKNKTALQLAKRLGEFAELRFAEIVIVFLELPIWRIAVKQSVGPVVASKKILVRKAFNLDIKQAFVSSP